MPGVHRAYGQQASCNTTFETCVGVTSATTVRPAITEVVFGVSGTPADNALLWLLNRYTAAGTSTSVTPHAVDPAFQGLALATAGQNHTVEPTYTAGSILLEMALHQKASVVWQARDDKSALVLPATASNGAGLAAKHGSYTGAFDGQIAWTE